MNGTNETVFNFQEIVNKSNKLQFPKNIRWISIPDTEQIVILRLEADHTSYLGVILSSTGDMVIYYHQKKVQWMKCDRAKNEDDIELILNILDETIQSPWILVYANYL